MMIREPAVAGAFYPAEPAGCLETLRDCLRAAQEHASVRHAQTPAQTDTAPIVLGGIVPHAGWVYSGAVAAEVFWELSRQVKPETVVVIFGAVHRRHGHRATVFMSGAWETPLGLARVGERLTERLLGQSGLLEADPHAHDQEHSIEVQVPFLQHLLPQSAIVPIMVPPTEKAAAVGAAVGRTCQAYGVDALFIGTTDLTHYGPGYGFTPEGVGPAGLNWAKEVNDRRMIELILALRDDQAVGEAEANQNACGAGAIAATIAACKARGATKATLLRHITSYEVASEVYDEPMQDAVGYAGIMFEK
jgi:MEMO1 family protein